ncbi:uncharacterized protein Triagg1_7625 [Trichoderma aggressivum f. europaeum]|uniref:Uncharacterized protein n=1 Tax=Trichoderma aggressivum f. europaeum TaxID=173218 RepID=A0AAE1J247_9HYPO|nr:hypothetical protein Triagg1_7625 [Trichoderma aggressivum f. europaeum]
MPTYGVHIDPCASITDTDSPRNIGASPSTDRQSICVAYSDTPEMLSFTLAGHAVENSPRPSACPNADMELGMGASALGIAEEPERSAAQTPSFLQRIPPVFPTAKSFKPLRCVAGSTAADKLSSIAGRTSWLGLLCSAPLLGRGSFASKVGLGRPPEEAFATFGLHARALCIFAIEHLLYIMGK